MDNLNLKNIQLAYGAVYDQELCESMEDLGFFDEQEQLNEISDRKVQGLLQKRSRRFSRAAGGVFDPGAGRMELHQLDRAIKAAKRRNERTGSNVNTEVYEIYELVLDHLLDEGYVDTVEGALAILENMSNDWIEYIVEEEKKNTGGWGHAAIDKDPLSNQKPDEQFLQWSKENPYDVNRRFFRTPGRPDRSSRTGSNVQDMITGKIRASRIARSPSPVSRETNTDIKASMPKPPKSSARRGR